ncbi:phage tail protein [Pseudomonas mosselii]|uniref:phage tail-collar fiber domain-containing protein n=1 Tax=Pseudomonas mosselii TaxID=78327 RepID=UPI00244A89C6|nr:phage tail protein [Pseudomonas mosselii]MDH1511888.1 phage tail protein [Pseudomonas mosselii]
MARVTLAGESLIAQKQGAKQPLVIARFIFANVPGLDPQKPVDRAAGKPPVGQIVHTYAIPPENLGYVNPNQVVYSCQLGSDIGDFDWNWLGLESAEGVLFAVAYVPVQQKRKNIPPLQLGNNVTRNILVEYNGAQQLTGISIDAKTWQHDFTARLAGIDERERLSNRDIYGRACFIGTALQLEKVGSAYQLKAGHAYLEGIRVNRSAPTPVSLPALPAKAWLDVFLERQGNDRVPMANVVFGADLVDYTDAASTQHYLIPLAEIPSAAAITDLRTVEPIDMPLVKAFATVQALKQVESKVTELVDGTTPAGKAKQLSTPRAISISGAGTGSVSFDGSKDVAIPLTLADSGVQAGTYTKVQVNAKGLVVGYQALTAADIPALDWGKITTGKPTTLAGYGITDAQPAAQILTDFVSAGGWGLGQGSPKYVNDGNAVILPGFYSAGGAGSTNFGDAYSPLLVMRRAAGNVGQQQINARDNEFMFRGSADDGLTWRPWVKVWHSGNLVKNVSQTDATPGSMLRNGDHGIGGQAVSAEVDLAKYRTGGKFITPESGLVGLPAGWAQGRHVIEVAGGDGYCVQRLTGASANKGRCAYRVWDGVWAAWDEVLTAKGLAVAEATLQDLVNKVSSSTYVSPRRLAEIAFGSGQVPVNMTGSKVWNTSYVNSTNKTIFVSIHVREGAGGGGTLSASLYIANELWAKAYMSGGSETTLEGPVPPGGSYGIFREDTNDQIVKWTEFR